MIDQRPSAAFLVSPIGEPTTGEAVSAPTKERSDAREVPPWLADMKFCHVWYDGASAALCGKGHSGSHTGWCDYYDGAAICSSCGYPTCPRCAQLSDLDDRLDEA